MGRDALRDQVGNPVGHHPGFATARSCQHQKRPLDMGRGLMLAGIERIERKSLHGRWRWLPR